jgi:putative FmdB family regulatory protein
VPIFEYKCSSCNAILERFEPKDSKLDAIQCPECLKKGKDNLAFRTVSKPNFVVHGFNSQNGYSRKS